MKLHSPQGSLQIKPVSSVIRSQAKLRTKAIYVPPDEDVESYSWAKMLTCWEQRDSACFWENFMWWVDRKGANSRYIVPFNTTWQPDQQGTAGSITRAITSDRPKMQWWAWNGSIPNPFVQTPKDIPNFRCIDYPNLNYVYARDCRSKCDRLRAGETVPERDASDMHFEAAGCDGSTAWCWCNSNPVYQH
jgi:hypothetical protein